MLALKSKRAHEFCSNSRPRQNALCRQNHAGTSCKGLVRTCLCMQLWGLLSFGHCPANTLSSSHGVLLDSNALNRACCLELQASIGRQCFPCYAGPTWLSRCASTRLELHAPEANPSLVARLALESSLQMGAPVASQEVSAAHLQGCPMNLQQLAQERLLIEVVPAHEHQWLVVRKALAGGAVPNFTQHTIRGIHLQHNMIISPGCMNAFIQTSIRSWQCKLLTVPARSRGCFCKENGSLSYWCIHPACPNGSRARQCCCQVCEGSASAPEGRSTPMSQPAWGGKAVEGLHICIRTAKSR